MVTIVIAHALGTPRVLRTCLASLKRYDAGHDYQIHVYGSEASIREAKPVCDAFHDIDMFPVQMPVDIKNSEQHMAILDNAMTIESGLVLTLDSDCFPVANDWLSELVQWHEQGYVLPGILWPWEPPTPDVKRQNMEWAIRRYHNWSNSWVACQLVHTDFFHDHKLTYGGEGNDTGFQLIDKVKELGLPTIGWMPSRCAKAEWASAFDNEFNRNVCLFYEDKMFHIGGAARKTIGIDLDPADMWGEAIELTLRKGGAEWLFADGKNHVFQFDKEDEVAAYKMKIMYAGLKEHLKTHETCFNS